MCDVRCAKLTCAPPSAAVLCLRRSWIERFAGSKSLTVDAEARRLWTNSGYGVVEGCVGRAAGNDIEKLRGVVVHDVPIAVKADPRGDVVMDGVEVRSLASRNRIRIGAAADSVVVHRIESAAGVVRSDFTRIDVDASLRRASDKVVIHRAAGAATPQVDTDTSAPDVVVGDFSARVASDGDVHADIVFRD